MIMRNIMTSTLQLLKRRNIFINKQQISYTNIPAVSLAISSYLYLCQILVIFFTLGGRLFHNVLARKQGDLSISKVFYSRTI